MPERAGLSEEEFDTVDFEIAAVEEGRHAARQRNAYGWSDFDIPGQPGEDASAMFELAQEGHVVTDLFLQDKTARVATLGMVRLRGDWDRDNDTQDRLTDATSPLVASPYNGYVFHRNHPESNLHLAIEWGRVSLQGLTMVARERRLLRTAEFEQELVDADGARGIGRMAIEVVKRSAFALNIDTLNQLADRAAQEIRTVVIAGAIGSVDQEKIKRAIGLEDYSTVRSTAEEERAHLNTLAVVVKKIEGYGLPVSEVIKRALERDFDQLRDPTTIAAIERDIHQRGGSLIPISTTFYAERILLDFTPTHV